MTVWSYVDQMNFSAIACRDHLPELAKVLDHCEDALDELVGGRSWRRNRPLTVAGQPVGSASP